jgi:hypothetical protein
MFENQNNERVIYLHVRYVFETIQKLGLTVRMF